MKLLLATIALAATLASPAFAQIVNGAPAPHGQYVVTPIVPQSGQGRHVRLPGDSISANAASRALMRQDDRKDSYLGF